MIKYILTMFLFGTFLMADNSQQYTKPTPTFTISDEEGDKSFARSSRVES